MLSFKSSFKHRHSFHRGFTLLELMIVLALMVGLLAIAWPNMQRPMNRTTLNEAAQVLREAIDDGRNEAITTGRPIFIQLQNDQHEVRSGAFDSFANEESEVGHQLSQSNAATVAVGYASHSEEKCPRTWRLPETVVITEVNWTTNSSSTQSEDELWASESNSDGSNDESTQGAHGTAKHSSTRNGLADTELNTMETEVAHSDWWLPISATGLSRSASIVLYDTSIHETLTVTYAAETGALEIVR